jgi:diketogulonate reductase-like aldo/keto reductase
MQTIAGRIQLTSAQLSLAWLLSKRICVIPKSNSKLHQEENFAAKDAIYSTLHFVDDMDKISVGKEPFYYLLETAILAKENAEGLDWN